MIRGLLLLYAVGVSKSDVQHLQFKEQGRAISNHLLQFSFIEFVHTDSHNSPRSHSETCRSDEMCQIWSCDI